MAKGIIYVMTTAVEGLIKIGRTQTNQFENRMSFLEGNGYRNVTGLKRVFAIEVDEYENKEKLLHSIFDRSRVPNTELFALDVKLAVQLLSAFEGKQTYPDPKEKTKEEVFEEAAEQSQESVVPEGIYFFSRKMKRFDNQIVKAQMQVKEGKFIVIKGSTICPEEGKGISEVLKKRRKNAKIRNHILQKDEPFNSCSMACSFVVGAAANGRLDWKTKEKGGEPIAIFFPKDDGEDE